MVQNKGGSNVGRVSVTGTHRHIDIDRHGHRETES